MIKSLQFLLFCVYGIAFSQIRYEKGYIINNKKERTQVLIKNEDWAQNPTQFNYKTSDEARPQLARIGDVQEFGVTDFSRYVRYMGPVDDSTDNLQNLSEKREPEWSEKTIFLKELVSGPQKLYVYNDSKIFRFFYEDEKTPIQQLIYKRYFPNGDIGNAVSNNDYKLQLKKFFAGRGLDAKIDRLSYKQEVLTNFFRKSKTDDHTMPKEAMYDRSKFNLYLKPGVAFNSVKFSVLSNPSLHTEFSSKASPRVGAELEFVLPFKKNKLAVFMESVYQTYSQTATNRGGGDAEVKYTNIELALGARFYMFANTHSKFFLDASVNALNLPVGDNYLYYNVKGLTYEKTIDLDARPNFGFSAGYTYKNKWVLQAKVYTPKTIVIGSSLYDVKLSNYTLAIGYNFL